MQTKGGIVSEEFEVLRAEFYREEGTSHEEVMAELKTLGESGPLLQKWRSFYRPRCSRWCYEHKTSHTPTEECPACSFCGALHPPLAAGQGLEYRGWRFLPPFVCMGCGIEVCFTQWAFSRGCGPCDMSDSKTRRLLYGKCFAGPKVQSPYKGRADIPEDHFVDPKERDKYPVIRIPGAAPIPKPPRSPRPNPFPRPKEPLKPPLRHRYPQRRPE